MRIVITRRESQEIWIGDPRNPTIKIGVRAIPSGDRVRISIEAPTGLPVHRAEVAKQIDDDGHGGGSPVIG